ncbi:hypothetical protein [Lysobacter gummosus]
MTSTPRGLLWEGLQARCFPLSRRIPPAFTAGTLPCSRPSCCSSSPP